MIIWVKQLKFGRNYKIRKMQKKTKFDQKWSKMSQNRVKNSQNDQKKLKNENYQNSKYGVKKLSKS